MPTKSAKQYGLMQGVAHGSIVGDGMPSASVAKEFIHKTPAKKRSAFAKHLKSSSSKNRARKREKEPMQDVY